MFDDMDLGFASTPLAPVVVAHAKSAAITQEVAVLSSAGFADLDAMVAAAEAQEKWRGDFAAGEEIEAVWDEDGQW
jgi:hypothetical protein